MQSDTQRRPDESMSLITSMLQRPLDPGYAAAADARAAAGQPRSRGTRSVLLVLAMVLIGVLVGVGASSLGGTATSRGQARAELISQIDARRVAVDRQTAQITALQVEVDRLDAEALGSANSDLQARLSTASAVAGAIAVTGPGVVVTLDDAPGSGVSGTDPGAGPAGNGGTVFARDLQIVGNSLWEAGAEAVSINGLRLTSTSAIRFAGEAILVDFRPLTPPYVITAIGDPASMPRLFTTGDGGAYLATLKSTYGIQVSTSPRGSVTVPAAASLLTRWATPRDTGSSPSPRSSTGGSP
jgi:uncharacterized protein YlxW (UPF0749 family)